MLPTLMKYVLIDDGLLDEALKVSGAETKDELVEMALRELIEKRNRELLRSELGTLDLELSWEELQEMRGEG